MNPKALLVTLSLSLTLPALAFSADRSVIIGFHQRPGRAEKALVRQARGKIKRSYNVIPAVVANLPEQQIEALRGNPNVAYVEEVALYQTAQGPPVGRERSRERKDSWGVGHLFADVAHASGNRGMGIRVAILDTGIDYTHEDLDGNYRGGYDFVFNDDDPFDDSYDSHGTHVAGIIAAEENDMGIVGVAPEADLFAVKVLDGAGFGTEDWIIAGIEWAVQNGIDIINLSIEGPDRQGLHDACDFAAEAGVLIVAAGGNSVMGGGPVSYPAAYDSVIAVTAIDPADLPGTFAPVGEKIDVAAPGVDILSTGASGTYHYLSGTSQAAPHVTGTAALLLRSNTQDVNGDGLVDSQDVRQIMQRTAIDLGLAGKDPLYGEGLVNAARASLTTEMTLTITRTSAAQSHDVKRIHLAGLPYNITIRNRGLSKVAVDVLEGNVPREDLSTTIDFRKRKQPRMRTFSLDATGARYRVLLTPYGRPGTSATFLFKRVGE